MRSYSSSRAAAVATAAALLLTSSSALAFSTRVHIAIANDVRESLIASPDGRTVSLKASSFSVVLSEEDARAITTQPLAFRAGAVGPDNMAFPAMTDPSHALYQRPYLQCQVLYEAAANDEERAYALGCFLHGTTDAVAHHYVNFMSDETFTMNPMRTGRLRGWDNVVRHIKAEGMIQSALLAQRPSAFTQGQLAHVIPLSFVARTYLSDTSTLYPIFAGHAQAAVEARMKSNQESFLVAAAAAGLAPADHLSLAPLYVKYADALRGDVRKTIEGIISGLQNTNTTDGAKLGVTPGPDGKLGTKDDGTACKASCATLYARYFVSIGLLAPRSDANNNPLPSAYDKVSEKLGLDLRGFVPAYLTTVDRVSTQFNAPLAPGAVDKLDYTSQDVATLFQPMIKWSDDITTIDYRTLSQAVVPGWIISLENALQSVGVTISVPDIMATLLSPIVQPIKDLIRQRIVDAAKTELEQLTSVYSQQSASTSTEYNQRIGAASAPALVGGIFGNFSESGIYVNAFNFAAATLGQHGLVLPADVNDPIGVGPASFDTSYTMAWSQIGVCSYLRDAVFPFGLDTKALLTVRKDGTTYAPNVTADSPIECHDGETIKFASNPTTTSCAVTKLPQLLSTKTGSLSRGFPPELGITKPACRNLSVPGLPAPPSNPSDDGGINPIAPTADGGCSCDAAGGSSASLAPFALVALLATALVRRRRSR